MISIIYLFLGVCDDHLDIFHHPAAKESGTHFARVLFPVDTFIGRGAFYGTATCWSALPTLQISPSHLWNQSRGGVAVGWVWFMSGCFVDQRVFVPNQAGAILKCLWKGSRWESMLVTLFTNIPSVVCQAGHPINSLSRFLPVMVFRCRRSCYCR